MKRRSAYAYLLDDDSLSNEILAKVLDENSLFKTIESNTSPEDALKYFMGIFEKAEPFPDVIFLDLYMPKVDGWKFLEIFKAAFGTVAKSKIVILSGTQRWADQVKGQMNEHVDYFLKKPVTAEELETMMADLF